MDKRVLSELLVNVEQLELATQSIKAQLQLALNAPTPTKKTKNSIVAESLSSDNLGRLPEYQNDVWPLAAPLHMLPKNATDKRFRATQIAALLSSVCPVDGLTVLDFGCGEGHLAHELSLSAKPWLPMILLDWKNGMICNHVRI